MLVTLGILAVAVLVVHALTASWGPLSWVAAGIAAFIVYWGSLKLNPYRFCWWCKGGKRRQDWIFGGAWGRCWICRGSGRRIRWGVVLLDRKVYQAIKAGQRGRNY